MVCAILSLASGAGTCACTCTCTLCTCAALFALPCLFVRVRECCRAQRTCTLQQSLWGQVQKPTPSKKGRAQASMIHNTVFGNRENTVRITEVKYLKRRGEARPTRLTGCRSRWNRRSCALAQSSSLSLSTANSHTVTLSLQRGSDHGEPPRPLGLSRVHAAPLDPLEGEGDAVEAPLLGE